MAAFSLIKLMFLLIFLIKFSYGSQIVLNHTTNIDYNVCKVTNCVRKCCPENYIFKGKQCAFNENYNFSFEIYEKDVIFNKSSYFYVIHDKTCRSAGKQSKTLKLSPKINVDDEFFIQNNGALYRPNNVSEEYRLVSFDSFCLETFVARTSNRSEFSALVCFQVQEEPENVHSLGKFG